MPTVVSLLRSPNRFAADLRPAEFAGPPGAPRPCGSGPKRAGEQLAGCQNGTRPRPQGAPESEIGR